MRNTADQSTSLSHGYATSTPQRRILYIGYIVLPNSAPPPEKTVPREKDEALKSVNMRWLMFCMLALKEPSS